MAPAQLLVCFDTVHTRKVTVDVAKLILLCLIYFIMLFGRIEPTDYLKQKTISTTATRDSFMLILTLI